MISSSPLQSDLSALPSFVVHKRALHPGATLMPTGMNNQFSPPSIPDPNTNSSADGTNNYVSSTANLDPKIALTRIIRDQKMIKNNNRRQVTTGEDDRRLYVETTGKVSSVVLCCCYIRINLGCEEIIDISNNNADSSSNKRPIGHEDIMDILTNNEALEINPDSPDEVTPNEEDVKVLDNQSVSAKGDC